MAFLGASGKKNHQNLGSFTPLPSHGGWGGLLANVKIVAFQFNSFNRVMFYCCLECLVFFNRVISVKAAGPV